MMGTTKVMSILILARLFKVRSHMKWITYC